MNTKEKTRFDTRLSQEQKAYLEYATRIGGFKSLSDFILSSANKHADQIIQQHKLILASQEDRDVFFHALLHPPKPNARLKKAAERYKKAAGKL